MFPLFALVRQLAAVIFALFLALVLTSCAGVGGAERGANVEDLAAGQPARLSLSERIDSLLHAADRSLRAGRLTTPANDNALDRFRAVLYLQPHNQRALAGIDDIVLRYAALTRDAIAVGNWDLAHTYISRAEMVKPDNPLMRELAKQLASAKQMQSLGSDTDDEVLLTASDLVEKEGMPSDRLRRVGERVRDTDEAILIVARTDKEGRWLYQQIKKSAEGYRVRGDIRIGSVPKVIFMPPL